MILVAVPFLKVTKAVIFVALPEARFIVTSEVAVPMSSETPFSGVTVPPDGKAIVLFVMPQSKVSKVQ